jgi:nicotinamidase-related amidase
MFKNDTAVVLIECQNEFCSKEGALYNAVKDVLEENRVLDNINNLLNSAREHCYVVHVPISFQQGYPEIGKNPYGILKGVIDAGAFQKNEKGSEFYDAFKPAQKDIIAEGKKTLCAFGSSNLDTVLRANNIKNLAFAGFLTNVCVEATARTAYDRGYNVFVISDCTAATSKEEQTFATEKIFPLFARVLTHTDFINQVLEGKELTTRSERGYYQ